MTRLGNLVQKIRSKNADPFWLTINIFCHDLQNFQTISQQLRTAKIAALFNAQENQIKRFDIPDMHVIKLSIPRPYIQGTRLDRDMHGASFACLLETYDI